ncbi:MAG: thiolase family protein [Candidatus Jordarchaeum sp.]|uniref:thiolase family protein n=1 Tax=Candidatus Jordarchaeum sp. TaxID=2823881 RepID=UPI00404B593D
MSEKVAIIGVAQKCGQNIMDSVRGLSFEVTKTVMDKVGITREDIGTIVASSSDYWQGMGCSNVFHYDAAAGYLKDSTKAEEDSGLALAYGYMRVRSGHFDTCLVIGITKCSEVSSIPTLTSLYNDPFYQRPIALEEISAAALQASQYMNKYGISEEDGAQVAVKNLKNALFNSNAHRKMRATVEDIMESPVTAYPLRELMCCPASDGACALILANEKKAKEYTDEPIWITGINWRVEPYFMGDRDLLENQALKVASKKAFEMAGIKKPLKELNVAEICEPYAFQELLWYEGLGFCKDGEGAKLLKDEVTEMDGELPVNPSGGVLSTNPFCARGAIRATEAALQLWGKAGERQVPNAEKALAHSVHGLGGQLHTVVILSR